MADSPDDLTLSPDLLKPVFPDSTLPLPTGPGASGPAVWTPSGRPEHQHPGPNDNLAMFQAGGTARGFAVPGGIPGVGGLVRNPLDTIEQYESGGRNILQTAYNGMGINPSTGTHTAPSSASGYYQITDSTWREWAPKVGIDIEKYPTAMSAPRDVQREVAQYGFINYGFAPWAAYNSRLASAVAWQGAGGKGVPGLGLGGAPPVDYTQLGKDALNNLGGAANGADLKKALGASGDDLSPWQRLQSLSLIQQLMGAGTHKFEPVTYDPFKEAKPVAVAAPALLPSTLGHL